MKIYRLGAAPLNGVGFATTDLVYIQEGVNEAVASIVSSELPEGYNLPVIMNGCVVSKVGTSYTHTGGQIYYQGFIHTVDALSTALVSAGNPKWAVLEVPATDNPVGFDNGNYYNIDIHLKFRLVASTDSGIVQYDEIRRLEHIRFNRSKEKHEMVTILNLPSDSFIDDNFDVTGLGIEYTKYEGFAIANGDNGTMDMAGVVPMGFNHKVNAKTDVRGVGDYLLGTIGNSVTSLVGKWKHLLTIGELAKHKHKHGNGSNGGDGSYAESVDRGPRSGSYDEFTDEVGNDEAHNNVQPSRICIMIEKVAEIA